MTVENKNRPASYKLCVNKIYKQNGKEKNSKKTLLYRIPDQAELNRRGNKVYFQTAQQLGLRATSDPVRGDCCPPEKVLRAKYPPFHARHPRNMENNIYIRCFIN